MQIRTRLTLLFVLIAAGILAGVLPVYLLFKTNTENAFEALKSKADMTAQTALSGSFALNPLTSNWIAPEDDTLPYRDNISIFNNTYDRVFAVRPDAPPVMEARIFTNWGKSISAL